MDAKFTVCLPNISTLLPSLMKKVKASAPISSVMPFNMLMAYFFSGTNNNDKRYGNSYTIAICVQN